MILLAVLAAAVAMWLAVPPPARRLPSPEAAPRRRRGGRVVVAGLVIAVIVPTALVGPGEGRLALAGVCAVATVGWLARRHHRRRAIDRVRSQVTDGCQALSGQLTAGQLPARALMVAAQDCPVLERAAASQRIGGDVPGSLREASQLAGAEGLASLASAWTLAERSGAPVADLVARVAEEQRDDQRVRAMVSSELAAPRATSKLLAVLPLVGIGMAAAVDADPLHFLGATAVGQFCVLGAVVLVSAGVVWTELLADRSSP